MWPEVVLEGFRTARGIVRSLRIYYGDRSRAAAGKPRRDIGRPTAQLDHIPARERRQQVGLRLSSEEEILMLDPKRYGTYIGILEVF